MRKKELSSFSFLFCNNFQCYLKFISENLTYFDDCARIDTSIKIAMIRNSKDMDMIESFWLVERNMISILNTSMSCEREITVVFTGVLHPLSS